jgi:urease accessory protein
MPWHARLQLHYTHDGSGTGALDRHEGPLRVLQRLYPEGPGICHHVLVHPPGGIVGGDVLELDARLESGCHALITTPGATRFYRSAGDISTQQVHCQLAEGARLEWLPMETIAYSACLAHNRLHFELAPGAEMIGWDVLALGLPAAGQAFERGQFVQELELPGAWLERGRIDATDSRLLDSPLGWAGRRVLATMWFACGSHLPTARRDALLDVARERVAQHAELASHAGATAPHDRVVVLRVLARRVEPAMQLFKQVWTAWRRTAWQLEATPPRLWRT